jgi:hypothetical protein
MLLLIPDGMHIHTHAHEVVASNHAQQAALGGTSDGDESVLVYRSIAERRAKLGTSWSSFKAVLHTGHEGWFCRSHVVMEALEKL